MIWKKEWKTLLIIITVFMGIYFLPVESLRFRGSFMESLYLARWYAREHVVLCLFPAFFIAGAIAVFVSQASVMRYLGVGANKVLAYGVASVSGTILAVCSCTVLPLFAGIYRMGAGIGPATAFLYSGPAINVLAIILTARVLGLELGIARAVGAIIFSVIIGMCMHGIFRREELERKQNAADMPAQEESRPLWQTVLYFASMVGILVFANWGKPQESTGLWAGLYSAKWVITSAWAVLLGIVLIRWFRVKWWKLAGIAAFIVPAVFLFPDKPLIPFSAGILGLSVITSTGVGETREWFESTWGFTKQITPLLLYGVLIAGFLLGRPDHEGIIPSVWVARAVGGNGVAPTFFASVAGAFMYFATLTEVPIVQGLVSSGMGKGPALALLLAGPALSLPNMLVIKSVMGGKKTVIYILLVVIMATISGVVYGNIL